MNRYQVIRTMQQAGLLDAITQAYIDEVEVFAGLVEAAEREACANVVDGFYEGLPPRLMHRLKLEAVARSIRARGQA